MTSIQASPCSLGAGVLRYGAARASTHCKESGGGRELRKRVLGRSQRRNRVEVVQVVVVPSVQEKEDLRTVRLRPVAADGPHTSLLEHGGPDSKPVCR